MLPQTQDIFNGMDPFDFIPGIVPDDGNELWWDAPLVIEGFDLLGVCTYALRYAVPECIN